MKYGALKWCLIVLFTALSAMAWAQNYTAANKPATQQTKYYMKSSSSKVSSEFGLGVGMRYNFFELVPVSANFAPKATMNLSYGAALQFRLNLGTTFGIQPEIVYAYSTMKFKGGEIKSTIKAKSNLVQIPILLSFRIAMVRLNFGPVVTVMDNPTYQLANSEDNSIQQMPLGKIFPTITYTAGISIKMPKNTIIDIRYADQFKDIESVNEFYWTLNRTEQAEALKFRTRSRNIQLRFGLVF